MKWGCDRRESLAAAGMNAGVSGCRFCIGEKAGGRHNGGEREND